MSRQTARTMPDTHLPDHPTCLTIP